MSAHAVLYNTIILHFGYGKDGWRRCLTLLVGIAGWWMAVRTSSPRLTATSSWDSSDSDRHVAVLMHAIGACRWERERNRVLILCE